MYPYQQFPYQPYQLSGGAAQPSWWYPSATAHPQASDGLTNVRTVSGEAEARQCACPLGSRVLLMDASEQRFYVKETGMDNVSTVKAYEFHEVSEDATNGEVSFEEWRKQYEPIIRRAAGIGQAGAAAEPIGAEPDAQHDDAGAGQGAGGAHLR